MECEKTEIQMRTQPWAQGNRWLSRAQYRHGGGACKRRMCAGAEHAYLSSDWCGEEGELENPTAARPATASGANSQDSRSRDRARSPARSRRAAGGHQVGQLLVEFVDAQPLAHAPQLADKLGHLLDALDLLIWGSDRGGGVSAVSNGQRDVPRCSTLSNTGGVTHLVGQQRALDKVAHLRVALGVGDVVQLPQLGEVELLEGEGELHRVEGVALGGEGVMFDV